MSKEISPHLWLPASAPSASMCRWTILPLLLLLVGSAALAQEAPPGAPAAQETVATAPAQEESAESLWTLVTSGGTSGLVFFAVLGLFSLVGVSIIFERLIHLRRGNVIPPTFVSGLRELIQREESNPEVFRELCEQSSAPIANILKAGLLRAGRPLLEVEKTMEDVASREASTLASRVRPLSVVGSVAPLVGLLGTVVGMIMAFRTASQAGLGKAEILAEGIYLALLTTAAGLTIAIPAMLFSAYFNSRADKYLRETDEHLMEVMPCIAAMQRGQQPSRTTEESLVSAS